VGGGQGQGEELLCVLVIPRTKGKRAVGITVKKAKAKSAVARRLRENQSLKLLAGKKGVDQEEGGMVVWQLSLNS